VDLKGEGLVGIIGTPCIICGIRPVAYEKVRHCTLCHSAEGKRNYRLHHKKKGRADEAEAKELL